LIMLDVTCIFPPAGRICLNRTGRIAINPVTRVPVVGPSRRREQPLDSAEPNPRAARCLQVARQLLRSRPRLFG
jgi:hypothetical protein